MLAWTKTHRIETTALAATVFGDEIVDAQFSRLTRILMGGEGEGYSDHPELRRHLRYAFVLAALLQGSPHLEHLTTAIDSDALREIRQAQALTRIRHGLENLDLIKAVPLVVKRTSGVPVATYGAHGVAPEWYAWCVAWYEQTLDYAEHTRDVAFYHLCIASRWLCDRGPAAQTGATAVAREAPYGEHDRPTTKCHASLLHACAGKELSRG